MFTKNHRHFIYRFLAADATEYKTPRSQIVTLYQKLLPNGVDRMKSYMREKKRGMENHPPFDCYMLAI
jgi:hypothetical protein